MLGPILTVSCLLVPAPQVSAPPARDMNAELEKAVAMVKEAVAYAKKHGKEQLIREVNFGGGRFHIQSDSALYVFGLDPKSL